VEGTYTLVIELADPARITFGAAGERVLEAGWYAYTGSAFGPGGFARVDRHRELAAGEREVCHWHVDFLLGHPASRVAAAHGTPGADVECAVARSLDGDPIPGLGASDCDCGSHLVFSPTGEPLAASVAAAHDRRL